MRKRLKLHKETLRRLDASRLGAVAGGLRSILPTPPIPTVNGFTCDGICVTLTCLTQCDVCELA